MPLSPGTTLGPYAVTAKIGEGGMGEVYRARDTKLDRDVALKVLPEAFTQDPDRLARFEREAKVLASLNHPNIAAIHGLEESEGTRALVLELVEGPTLADRIKRGPIPLDEALPIAKQIAEALEAAHEKGIIHRDLKPANIKVRDDGMVKVLDFGLAKALDPNPEADPSQSPTLTAAATQMGVIMGTAAYMSPEQARGKPVDKRADIWAFGVVFLEMLTGRTVFEGEDVSMTLSSVLQREPDWSHLPSAVSPSLSAFLHRCLDKESKQRVGDIRDMRLAMEGAFESTVSTPSAPVPDGMERASPLKVAVPLAIVALVVGSGGTWWVTRPASVAPAPTMRLEATLTGQGPDEEVLGAALSPDGTHLAYVVGRSEATGLFLRALDEGEDALLVSGNVWNAFFSPDGQWVGYTTLSEVRKVPVSGGASQTVAASAGVRSGTWAPDDVIIFGGANGLFRVSADGGEPVRLTQLGEGEGYHLFPQMLPGSQAVLFVVARGGIGVSATSDIEVLDLDTGTRSVVQPGSAFGRYAPTGHLLYVVNDALFAAPFDLATGEVSGSATPVEAALGSGGFFSASFSVSNTGTLAYLSADDSSEYPVVWVDREGNTTPLWEEAGRYGSPRLSPDGRRLALTVYQDDNLDVWVYDIERGVSTRVTFDSADDSEIIWSPDGRFLAFMSDRDVPPSVYRTPADGSGEVERLTTGDGLAWPASWSGDGRVLIYHEFHPETSADIWLLPLEEDREPELFINSEAFEAHSALSPDGRWLAYSSNESGESEVYVRRYPAAPGQWQVSSDGGGQPRWSADSRELFYRTESGIMVVAVDPTTPTFTNDRAEELLSGSFRGGVFGVVVGGVGVADYDVTADGQRFVMFPGTSDDDDQNRVTVVVNWTEELKRLVPTGQ